MNSETNTDKVLTSILQCRLKAITEEMGYTLLRTSRSPILNEARDFVTGLYDARGRMMEQAEYIPVLAFAIQPVCQRIVEYFGSDIHPGDVILHNDVFTGGNQNADVAVFKPIFHNDVLFAWAAVKGHQADIGGAVAGGYNPDAREVWQEALRITPVKVFEKGKLRQDVWDLIFANIRYPIVAEDIKAQIGACAVGEKLVHSLLQRYGFGPLCDQINLLFDSTEKMVRAEIRRIPDGQYHGQSYMYYDGIHDGSRFKINLTVTVKNDEIFFDYTGTDEQTEGFANAPLGASMSAVILTFLMLIDPDIPHNDGLLRPLHVHIPSVTFLNANFPAATTFGNSITGPNADAILKALAAAIPHKVTAGWNRMLALAVSGIDPRANRPYVDILFNALKGGSGAVEGCDGYDHIGLINCAGGILAQDPEMFELQTPNRITKHEYAQDSAGTGRWRGGLGVETVIQFGGEKSKGVVFGDGVDNETRAFGLFGGNAGGINEMEFRFPNGSRHRPKSKEIVSDIPHGTILRQVAGGGGGYGDPYLRSAERVAREVRNGTLSLRKAREEYGIVIDPKTMGIKKTETKQLRGKGGKLTAD
jgi:N-methylhydantoinase B